MPWSRCVLGSRPHPWMRLLAIVVCEATPYVAAEPPTTKQIPVWRLRPGRRPPPGAGALGVGVWGGAAGGGGGPPDDEADPGVAVRDVDLVERRVVRVHLRARNARVRRTVEREAADGDPVRATGDPERADEPGACAGHGGERHPRRRRSASPERDVFAVDAGPEAAGFPRLERVDERPDRAQRCGARARGMVAARRCRVARARGGRESKRGGRELPLPRRAAARAGGQGDDGRAGREGRSPPSNDWPPGLEVIKPPRT